MRIGERREIVERPSDIRNDYIVVRFDARETDGQIRRNQSRLSCSDGRRRVGDKDQRSEVGESDLDVSLHATILPFMRGCTIIPPPVISKSAAKSSTSGTICGTNVVDTVNAEGSSP